MNPSSDANAWIHDLAGRSIGMGHRIVRHLASGGMAHVFLAEQLRDGSYTAVKLADPRRHAADALLRHEAALLRPFDHPHVVRMIELGPLGPRDHYLMLEYVSGIDLQYWLLHARNASRVQRSLAIVAQLASALDYLHQRGVVHGDIKPANVMVDAFAGDRVKLVDFGLAFDPAVASARVASTGTPGYMAPEQARGGSCGPAIDRYALAAVAFELITGIASWRHGSSPRARTRRARTLAFTQLPAAARALKPVFTRALAELPEARFDSAHAFHDALVAACGAALSGARSRASQRCDRAACRPVSLTA